MKSAICLSLLLALFLRVKTTIVLNQPEAAIGRLGCSLRLTCQTSGFDLGSQWMAWFRQPPGEGLDWIFYYLHSASKHSAPGVESRFTASKDLSNNIFALEVKNPGTEDNGVYYCAMLQQGRGSNVLCLDYWGQGTMVTVAADTPSPPSLYALLSSCEDTGATGAVTYGCLAIDYSAELDSVSWKKDQAAITTGLRTYPSVLNKKGTHTLSSQLTIPESEVGSSTVYCVVQRGGSVWKKEMPDRVVRHPTILLTLTSNEEISSSRFATIVCSIVDFRPDSISVKWLKNGQAFNSGIVTSPAFEVNGNFSATSRLTVPTGEWSSNTIYACEVTHKGVRQSRNITRHMGGPGCTDPVITLLPPPTEQVLLEATVTLICSVTNAPYGISLNWTQETKTLKSEIALQTGESPNSVVSKLNISTQAWLSGAEFHCVVSHQDLPTPLRNSIHKKQATNPREPSMSVLLPSPEDVSTQKFISLSCLVRGFSPREIFVKWTVNDKPVNPGNYKNTEVMAENDNSTFFMYSLLSIAAEEWASGASYSCVVGHETIPLKIINRTIDKSSDSTEHLWIEDYVDNSNIRTTSSTFIILFLLSIFYSTVLTLVKLRRFNSIAVHTERSGL